MNKIKVLAICTSPRKNKQTEELLNDVLLGAKKEGAETEMFTIYGKDLNPCRGCLACQKGGKCSINDDIKILFDKIKEADGIVIGSPVYFYDVTAQCKMIMDRSHAIQPINGGKVGGVVTVAGSIGTSDVVKNLTMFYNVHGITPAGFVASYGKSSDNIKGKESAFKLGVKIVKMVQAQRECEEGIFDAHGHYAYGTHTF